MSIFIAHVCKNSRLNPKDLNFCERIWVDEDKYNAQKPPTYRYCPDCAAKGFKNKGTKNITKTPEQIEQFKERMKKYRESKNNDNI